MSEAFSNSNNEIHFSNNDNFSLENEDELVSDKVHILANSVYQEFEILIKKFGPGTVDGLMPLVVSILETMDKLYTCKDEMSLQLDLIKEDQKELYSQYDREKLCRRLSEEKNNRLEDQFEEEKTILEDRIEFLESNNKLMEMRNRNWRDLILRLEEKEAEMRKEYNNLQLRYSDLLKNKVDHGQRLRSLNSRCANEDIHSGHHSPVSIMTLKLDKLSKIELINEAELITSIKKEAIGSDFEDTKLLQTIPTNDLCLRDEIGYELKSKEEIQHDDSVTINQKLNFYMNEEPFENFEASINNCNDDDDISLAGDFDDLVMGKEIDFLIKENQDLVETKTALNIVKDDLINKLDEMTGEMCLLREDLRSAMQLKKEYRAQIQELEKKICEISESLKIKECRLLELGETETLIECSINENGVQTKTKFTRTEVARILHERNKYKEELLELQESLRYQSTILHRGVEKSRKGTLWNIFSNVLSNATAFTTEAFIGSNIESAEALLNKKLSSRENKALCYVQDEHGVCIQLPDLTNNSPSKNGHKMAIPGSAVRITNPLLANLNDDTRQPSFNLVPIDENQSQFSQ